MPETHRSIMDFVVQCAGVLVTQTASRDEMLPTIRYTLYAGAIVPCSMSIGWCSINLGSYFHHMDVWRYVQV